MVEGAIELRDDVERARERLVRAADAIELRLRTPLSAARMVRRHPVAFTAAGVVLACGVGLVVVKTVRVIRAVRRNLLFRVLRAVLS